MVVLAMVESLENRLRMALHGAVTTTGQVLERSQDTGVERDPQIHSVNAVAGTFPGSRGLVESPTWRSYLRVPVASGL